MAQKLLFCITKFREDKNIKKTINIILVIVSLVVLILATVYGISQTSYVQKIVINKIASGISESIDADVSIGRVKLSLFSKVVLEDFYLSDQQKDTLLYTHRLVAGVDSLSIMKKNIHFKSISLVNPKVYAQKFHDNSYNFSFIMEGSEQKAKSFWKANCSKIEIKNGELTYLDSTLSKEVQALMHIQKINLMLDKVNLNSGNNFSFNLENLKFVCGDGLEVKELSTGFWYADSTITLNKLKGATANSILKLDTLSFDLKKYLVSHDFFDLKFDFLIDRLKLDDKDFSLLFPEFKGDGFTTEISGRIYGKPGEIKGKNFKASLGELTRLNGDFYINGLASIENTYIFINLKESYANLTQLRNIELPEKLFPLRAKLPKFLDNLGVFTYSGNFTGFINDFVAYGTAYSNLGSIECDISLKPDKFKALKIHGRINTKNLHIGTIFNAEQLGKLTLNGDIDGMLNDTLHDLTFNGIIDTVDINNYKYRNITVKGNLKNKLFDGTFTINDPNLKLNFSGNLDLSPALPIFKFRSDINYADLKVLNLTNDSIAKISGVINANFEGTNIDNMEGKIDVEQFRYKNLHEILFLEKATIENNVSNNTNFFTVKSDWFDAEIKGHYSFLNMINSLKKIYKHYLPSSSFASVKDEKFNNDFSYVIKVKNIGPLTRVFVPKLIIESPFVINGFFNEGKNEASLEMEIPSINYSGQELEKIKFQINGTSDNLICDISSENFMLAKNINFQDFKLHSNGKNDVLGINLSWKNNGIKKSMGKISTVTTFEKSDTRMPHIVVSIDPSDIYITDSLWQIKPSTIEIDSTSFKFHDVSLVSGDQLIHLKGSISENSEAKSQLEIKDIDIHLINNLIGYLGLEGKLSGKVDIGDIYKQKKVNLNLNLANFTYDGACFGDLVLESNWNDQIEKLVSNISLKDKEKLLICGSGLIDPIHHYTDLNLNLEKTPIKLLEMLVPFLFYDMEGYINGKVHVSGLTNHLSYDGKLTPESKIKLGLTYLKSHYYFSDPVYFKGDSILFPSMKMEDELGNKAIFDGYIKHTNFMHMFYDLTVHTKKLLVMNTTLADNEYFYGTAIASGFLSIKGKDDELMLDGDFKSEKGTSINIPLDRKNTIEKYDFISFVNSKSEKEQPTEYKLITSGLNMNFDVDVTPDAKVQLIFNSQIGDIIKGEGDGNLQVKVDKDYNIKLYGDYTIEKGDYLFTLENIINKRFTIDRGGTIKWTGDPYDAQIDITAIYKVKTSLYDLFAGSNTNIDLVRRLPVDCTIKLSESLMQPAIDFKIELPTAEESIKDELNRLIVTKEDVNKQMLSLLMMGRFYTPEIFAAKAPTETGSELMGATASELFSNQLSNWLSQISDQFDIGVNYRPGNEISNDQVELALSTQIFNDRVTIDGNVANNSNLSTSNSGELVGDFDVKIKLTKDGRLQFKAYNHSNDNLIYATSPYTQGVGFSYREEFNTLKELFVRYKNAILRKKNKSSLPKNN